MGLIVVIKRELRLAVRQAGDGAVIVMFFVLAAILFPFGILTFDSTNTNAPIA